MFDAEKLRTLHCKEAIGYSTLPPMTKPMRDVYQRFADLINKQVEAEMKPWAELVRDIVQMFELEEHYTLADYENVMARAAALLAMARAKAMLAAQPEPAEEEKTQ